MVLVPKRQYGAPKDNDVIDPEKEFPESPAVFCRTLESLLARDRHLGLSPHHLFAGVPSALVSLAEAILLPQVIVTSGIFRLQGRVGYTKEMVVHIETSR